MLRLSPLDPPVGRRLRRPSANPQDAQVVLSSSSAIASLPHRSLAAFAVALPIFLRRGIAATPPSGLPQAAPPTCSRLYGEWLAQRLNHPFMIELSAKERQSLHGSATAVSSTSGLGLLRLNEQSSGDPAYEVACVPISDLSRCSKLIFHHLSARASSAYCCEAACGAVCSSFPPASAGTMP
jgi:hypothetical protein